MNALTHTHAHTHTHTRAHTHRVVYQHQGNGTEEKGFKKRKVFKEDMEELTRGRMTDRNRELVPDNWSLVRERAPTTGPCSKGCLDGILNTPVSAEERIMGGALGSRNSSVVRALDS